MYKIKNQNELPWFANDCTIYTCVTILELTYWIIIPSKIAEQLSLRAYENSVLKDWGAVFSEIYPWVAEEVSKATGLNIIVEKLSINSNTFRNKVNEGYYYWIGLQHGNDEYLYHVNSLYINPDDVDDTLSELSKWQHNHAYGKSIKNDSESIIEIARWLEVDCTLDTLRYWVNKWMWWSPARTFVWWDNLTNKALAYLRQIHFDPDSELIVKTDLDQRALNKASEINKEWKIDFKYN